MARLDEHGRRELDTVALDRYITGNYGEDQLSCSDPDDDFELDVEDDEEDWDEDEELGEDDEEGDE